MDNRRPLVLGVLGCPGIMDIMDLVFSSQDTGEVTVKYYKVLVWCLFLVHSIKYDTFVELIHAMLPIINED